MTRQLALGAIIGFALTVLGLAWWERPANAPEAPPDAGAATTQELKHLGVRSEVVEALPLAPRPVRLRPAAPQLTVLADGGS